MVATMAPRPVAIVPQSSGVCPVLQKLTSLLIGLTFWGLVSSAIAQDLGTAHYDTRYAGIRIATSTVTGFVEGSSYGMSLDSEYSVVVYSGTISARVSGRRQAEKILPQTYSMVSGSDPEYRTAIDFAGNAPGKITIEPPLEPNWNEGRITLKPEHTLGALDPMSAFVFASLRAGLDLKNTCNTVVPVFTGLSRFDLIFSPRSETSTSARVLSKKKAAADVIRCQVRFVPIAGHKPTNQTVKALSEATTIAIDFDAALSGSVRMPRRIEIPTRFGTVTIERSEKERS